MSPWIISQPKTVQQVELSLRVAVCISVLICRAWGAREHCGCWETPFVVLTIALLWDEEKSQWLWKQVCTSSRHNPSV